MFSHERRASRRALLPLIIMASVFVLPTYRSCSDEPLHSPAHFAASDLSSAMWVAPSFLVAGLLALLTLRALRRKEVDLTTRRLGLVAIGALAVCSATTNTLMLWPLERADVLALSVMTAVMAGAVLLIRRARGAPGWRIWEHLLAAFALVVAVSGPAVFLGHEVFFGSGKLLGPGGYLYVGAALVLLFLMLGARRLRAAAS
ncbi:MAG: hypothetical protein Q8S33_38295 [Myxococcales bacterium]|nr:hypothetical protein [Myxococcales bacterium]MDP3506253.1 hypothetical protein [Myxococcales bacterium]